MHVSEQAIFERFFDAYAASHKLHPRQRRAAQCIRGCGTRALGAHVLACPSGALEQLQFHACRHRSCPRCADAARSRWINSELQRLLPCSHFHVIFTLPHGLLPLWEFNREHFMALLMRCVRESLLTLLADTNYLGAVPGLLMSLHTWGRTLSHHPHVHCLVSAGGIDAQGHWRTGRKGWLLPVKPLQALFRGKLLAGVLGGMAHGWQLPAWSSPSHWRGAVHRLHHKHWNIEIRPPYEHGRGVVLYLARYAKGGPLPRSTALDLQHDPVLGHTVSFDYTDHRDGSTKRLRLSVDEFISRLLWHAPPRGQHTTRHAGLYSTSHRAQHRLAMDHIHAQPPTQPTQPWPRPAPRPPPPHALCPHCGLSLLRVRSLPPLTRSTQPGPHQNGEIYPQHIPPVATTAAHHLPRGPTRRSSGPPMAEPAAAPRPIYDPAARRQAQPLAAA